ncbi:MAG: hypothetical protein KIS96_09845 [Bauldia sp.]|nr:hypothetical protein [Bauldia sp.]
MASALAMPAHAQITQERLENAGAEPHNWLLQLGNYASHSYSSLDQINRDNVADLRAMWTIPITTALANSADNLFGGAQLEMRPLVVDGMMYFNDPWGIVYGVDISNMSNPRIMFVTDPAMARDAGEIPVSRGVALWDTNIWANLADGRVTATDMNTGELLIDVQIARTEAGTDFDIGEGFTASPLPAQGLIMVGQSKGDWATRGYLAAVDAESGEEVWRTYTIPGPGEPGHETWADEAGTAWRTGGGSLWQVGSYDPAQNITIWGTANPVPMFDPEYRPGDNLYTNSALAFDVDDGSIVWYFQYTPNESWDYDEIGVHALIDAEVDGEMRQMVVHFARNGYYYRLDRTDGTFIGGTQYVEQITWTAGLDPKTGMPVEYDPDLDLQVYLPETRQTRDGNPSIAFCPTLLGGVRWQPTAYNPETGINYVSGIDGCSAITVGPEEPTPGQIFIGADFAAPAPFDLAAPHGQIVGVDVMTGEITARLLLPQPSESGVLATAGGLVFHGGRDGRITAHNDETLEELWAFPTNIGIKAAPMTFAVDGQQYVAIIAGTNGGGGGAPELANQQTGAMLYVFGL